MVDEELLIQKQRQCLTVKPLFDVEITTKCNKSCSICPRSKLVRQNRVMEKDTLIHIASWLPSSCHVMFAGLGEPLTNSNCCEYISTIAKHGPTVTLYTNGLLLSDQKVDELFDAGLNLLQISVVDKSPKEVLEDAGLSAYKGNTNKIRFNILVEHIPATE